MNRFGTTRLALGLLVLALAGCTLVESLDGGISRLRNPKVALVVGKYRHPDVYWTTTIELRADRTFRHEQMTDTFDHSLVDGTWSLAPDGVVVTTGAKGEGVVRFVVVRDTKGDLGLLRETILTESAAKKSPRPLYPRGMWRSLAQPPGK